MNFWNNDVVIVNFISLNFDSLNRSFLSIFSVLSDRVFSNKRIFLFIEGWNELFDFGINLWLNYNSLSNWFDDIFSNYSWFTNNSFSNYFWCCCVSLCNYFWFDCNIFSSHLGIIINGSLRTSVS